MSNRRNLTPTEKQWADNLKREWLSQKSKGKITQQECAEEFGWTQGAVGQYINGKIPLNTDAKRKFASYLGIKISKIDALLRDFEPTKEPDRPLDSSEDDLSDQAAIKNAKALLSKMTPRSKKVIQNLESLAGQGKLTDDDMLIIDSIVKRFTKE